MTEEKEEKTAPFDAEWVCRKLSARIMDIMDVIDELKAKNKSLSARISRLKLSVDEGQPYDEELPEEPEMLSKLEKMSLEERAIHLTSLIDRVSPPLTEK